MKCPMMTIAYLDILVFYHLSLGPNLAGLLEVVTNVDCFCFLFSILGRNGEEGPPEGGRGERGKIGLLIIMLVLPVWRCLLGFFGDRRFFERSAASK
jgi:hypothetical protein